MHISYTPLIFSEIFQELIFHLKLFSSIVPIAAVCYCTKSLTRRLAPDTIIFAILLKKIAVFEYMLYC